MIYKLLNRLFGWDYIQWRNSADYGIARVFVDGSGRVIYWRYSGTRCMDEITDYRQVYWLTCNPNKYMKDNK